jgi:hypothetical protein
LAIAIPASQQILALSFLLKDNVSRPALVKAAIEVAAETLENIQRETRARNNNDATSTSRDGKKTQLSEPMYSFASFILLKKVV